MTMIAMILIVEAYRPVSSSELRHPHSFRRHNYFLDSVEVSRVPHQELIDPFLHASRPVNIFI